MVASTSQASLKDFSAPLENIVEIRQSEMLTSTVRPVDAKAPERPGLYVFRFFEALNENVEEIVRLSSEAWKSFENEENYEAEPQGLFCPSDLSEDAGRMLLVTWYDGLQSWQTSREPPEAARENFGRRRELTRSTVAIATVLVS